MNIEDVRRPRGEAVHILDNLAPGQCFRVDRGTAVYLRLHGSVTNELMPWEESGYKPNWTEVRKPRIYVPPNHIPVISLESGRLFSWPEGKEVIPVYADVVVKT